MNEREKGIGRQQRTRSRSFRQDSMTLIAFISSSSEITNGGANRMLVSPSTPSQNTPSIMATHILTCVGFANTPRLISNKQNCHALLPFVLFVSSMTTAFNSPRPRTHATRGELRLRMEVRKSSPRRKARAESCSSTRTSRAVMATAQPRGFLRTGRNEFYYEFILSRRLDGRTRRRCFRVHLA